MTTEDYLTQLQQDREDLVDNLEAKGITGLTGDETFTQLVPEVLNIPSGTTPTGTINISYNDTYDVTDYANAVVNVPNGAVKFAFPNSPSSTTPANVSGFSFAGDFRTSLQSEIDNIVANVDLSTITSTAHMFEKCGQLQNIDLSNFKATNILSAERMFYYCSNLTIGDIDKTFFGFTNISNVRNFTETFSGDTNLTSIDLSDWNPQIGSANINDPRAYIKLDSTFTYCTNLTSVDLSSLNPLKETGGSFAGRISMSSTFKNCTSLTFLDIRSLTHIDYISYVYQAFGTSASDGPPNNCLIIVKDDTERTNFKNKFGTRFTNIKTVAEYEGS